MTSPHVSLVATIAVGAFVFSPTHAEAAISVFWDFYDTAGNANGWTVVSGAANYRSGDGGGVGPANGGNTAYAQDSSHPNFIFRSPTINISTAATSGTVMSWGTSGGAGDQELDGRDYANPAAVLAFNTGNSSATGEKGLAFLNLATGNYDAVFFNLVNGGTDTRDFTLSDLTTAGVNAAQDYRIDFYETDQGTWGWGQMNFLNLDATVVPEPSSLMLLGLGSLALLSHRRKQ